MSVDGNSKTVMVIKQESVKRKKEPRKKTKTEKAAVP